MGNQRRSSEVYRVVAERSPRSIPPMPPPLHHPREIIDAVETAGRVVNQHGLQILAQNRN